MWCNRTTTNYKYKVWCNQTTTNYKYKVWCNRTTTNYKYKVQCNRTTTNYKYRCEVQQTINTRCDVTELQQTINTNYKCDVTELQQTINARCNVTERLALNTHEVWSNSNPKQSINQIILFAKQYIYNCKVSKRDKKVRTFLSLLLNKYKIECILSHNAKDQINFLSYWEGYANLFRSLTSVFITCMYLLRDMPSLQINVKENVSLTERSDSLHSSTASLSQLEPGSQEEKKEKGNKL